MIWAAAGLASGSVSPQLQNLPQFILSVSGSVQPQFPPRSVQLEDRQVSCSVQPHDPHPNRGSRRIAKRVRSTAARGSVSETRGGVSEVLGQAPGVPSNVDPGATRPRSGQGRGSGHQLQPGTQRGSGRRESKNRPRNVDLGAEKPGTRPRTWCGPPRVEFCSVSQWSRVRLATWVWTSRGLEPGQECGSGLQGAWKGAMYADLVPRSLIQSQARGSEALDKLRAA